MSLQHKGYSGGPIELDPEAGTFSGVVIGLRDVVHFSGRTAQELKQAFQDSVDDYLAMCAERGEQPEKPYNGRLLVRLDPELHRRIATRAAAEGVSLNAWIARQIELAPPDHPPPPKIRRHQPGPARRRGSRSSSARSS